MPDLALPGHPGFIHLNQSIKIEGSFDLVSQGLYWDGGIRCIVAEDGKILPEIPGQDL